MENEKICVTKEFFRDIVIYAFRYAVTRKSYAGALFTDWLIDNMEIVSDGDLELMVNEINENIDNGSLTGIDETVWKAFCTTMKQLRLEKEK